MNVSDGWAEILRAIDQAMEPDPPLHVDDWAEEHIVLRPPAAVTGPYRIAHTPMARRILQALGPGDPHTRIVVRGASQLLKTQAAICAILAWIDLAPANILALEPTDKLAKRLSARLNDAITNAPVLADKVAAPRSRDSRNTIDAKDFRGGTLYIVTAGTSSNLSEIPARYVFLDEVDRMAANIDQEGDPIDLAEARTTTYDGRQKIYIVSSPTVRDASPIDTHFERGTQETYHVPCPHCAELHPLELEHFRHSADSAGNVERAWFVCPHCGCEIDESAKATMLPDETMGGKARWISAARGDGQTLSFEINSFYAPLGSISWLSLARQYQRAQEQAERYGNIEPMRVFYNTRLARSYAYANHTPEPSDLRARAITYPELTIPSGGLILTAGVDVQHDRLAVIIRAWGRGEESWLVYWGEIHGNTADAKSGAWADLDELLAKPLPHALGGTLRMSAVSIDGSDGARTETVHNFVRPRRHRGFMAVKGAAEQTNDRREIFAPPKMVDIGRRQKPTRFGLHTYIVGTARAKDLILETRLALQGTGAGRIHWYAGVRPDYWEQLTAEVKVPQGPKRRMTWTKKGGTRNEALDGEVYALHAARSQKVHLLRDAHWVAIEQRLRQRNLLDAPAALPEAGLADHVEPDPQDTRSQESGALPDAQAPASTAHHTDDAAPVGGPAEGEGAASATPSPGVAAKPKPVRPRRAPSTGGGWASRW